MRIRRTLVRNFRGVRLSCLENLGDLVVLAGQNGSGKSCILDAIRLIKSVYGGYQQNEFHHWFGEFQINFTNDPRAFVSLFNDVSQPLSIEIDVEIHAEERAYLKHNSKSLITAQAWRAIVPELYSWRSLNAAPFTAQFRSRELEVQRQADQDMAIFNGEIDLPYITARVSIEPNSQPQFNPSKLLELVFSTFDLEHFGIIDYHGPHRNYGREVLNNINVNIDALEEQRKQSALYNYNTKYSNVKSEMASIYVREALAEKAGHKFDKSKSITETLKELFVTFFPEKEFLGPQPREDGSLRFPVKVGGRESHDLDELSSGEKEILYGYLRLRSSAPKNSVILLDEPELHLNPRLTRNLPDFYYRHLAQALGNQVWLITHSDAILRESVGKHGVSVFHITPSAYSKTGSNQARPIEVDEDLERAIIDLVGDLAAYSPGGKVVIFEGEESDFDLRMASELFPELPGKANLISGSNKSRVQSLHLLLQRLSETGRLPLARIFSVTDRDSEIDTKPLELTNSFSWNVYHIENYLLEPTYIFHVLRDLAGPGKIPSLTDIEFDLRQCALETMKSLVLHRVNQYVNKEMITSVSTRIDPSSVNIAAALSAAVESSRRRLETITASNLSQENISRFVSEIEAEIGNDLKSGDWKSTFRGRDILKRFSAKHAGGLKYSQFRNLIIARMREAGFRPEGMKKVLEPIMEPQPV